MIRFASLGSGSRGNALVVEAGRTRVLVDCGFGLREAGARLARLGLEPDGLRAVLVTHEHADHIGGAFAFAARHALPVLLTHGTLLSAPGQRVPAVVQVMDSDGAFGLDDLQIHPFPVPHDAREPVQFVFSDGAFRLGAATDLGMSTPHVERMLSGCDALVLECNHDAGMLAAGNYPPRLKARIAGRFGHLENSAAAMLLAALDRSRLRHVVAAHLSEHNNRPELARGALAAILNCEPEWIGVACQDEGFGWRELR